jgi:hypothetical protein
MPFKSEAQRKYLWANEPEIARDWTDTYGSGIKAAQGGRIGFRVGKGAGMEKTSDTGMPTTQSGAISSGADYGRTSHHGDTGGYKPTDVAPRPKVEPKDTPKDDGILGYINKTRSKIMPKLTKARTLRELKRRRANKIDSEEDLWESQTAKPHLDYNEKDINRITELQDYFDGGKGNFNLTQDQYYDIFPSDKPVVDTGGGGGEGQIPWWLRQQAPVASAEETPVADEGLGSGHFQVPLKYVVGGVRAAEGGRIGFFTGMREQEQRDKQGPAHLSHNAPPQKTSTWHPGVGGTQHIPTPRPTPDRFPDRGGGGIGNINPYINVNPNRYDNQKRDWEDYLRNIGDENYNIPSNYRAEVSRAQYNTLKSLGQVGNVEGKASGVKGLVPEGTFDSIQPSEWDQIFEGAKYKDIKQVVAEGGLIGSVGGISRPKYQQGNMVEGEIEGAEMEGAMMQSQEVIKELYDALIAQGLSPQEAMEKIKQMIASSQTQEPQSPMMGEEFPGQEFGRAPAAFGGIMDTYTGRRKYGFGSFLKKGIKKLKKLAGSKLGKLALMYAAGTYLGGTQAFGGTGQLSFAERLRDPKLLANLINPTGSGVGEGKGWSMFQKAAPQAAEATIGGLTGKGPAKWADIAKVAPDVAKSDWSKYILPASLAAGAYTAAAPVEGLDDTQGEYDKEKAWWDNYYADMEGAYRVPDEYIKSAQGGRIGRQEGGLMNLGGMEKDYRNDGGFVPIGGQEKADDVPARLSRNEFVFTADAVRNAGGGDIDRGAEVMENVMKNLEAGGKVSEESQGQGAQEMFETSERLSEVI